MVQFSFENWYMFVWSIFKFPVAHPYRNQIWVPSGIKFYNTGSWHCWIWVLIWINCILLTEIVYCSPIITLLDVLHGWMPLLRKVILFQMKSYPDQYLYVQTKRYHGFVVCLFVCLTGRSMRRHTWVLMGPDSNKMLKPGLKPLDEQLQGWMLLL